MCRCLSLLLGGGLCCWMDAVILAAAVPPPLQLATFRVDVTPPLGEGPCVGFMTHIDSIEHPLHLRGIVFQARENIFVLAAIDYCGICNSSYDTLCNALATAAGTTPSRVALQSLHQHTAPVLDADAVSILHGPNSLELQRHLRFTEDISQRAAAALSVAITRLRPVSRIVGTRAKVERVASNRRVPGADGTILTRPSLTHDLQIRHAPEGLIDPWARTLTFFDGEQPLVQLHYYATHPQSFYGDARISWDTVGMARERLERHTGVFQIYFTGCGGNVAIGKYNDGSRQARDDIAERLFQALRQSAESAIHSARPEDDKVRVEAVVEILPHSEPVILWDEAPLKFTTREDGAFHPTRLQQQLDTHQPFPVRLTAAMFLGFADRLRHGHVPKASRLRVGSFDLLHLPGEPFVEFQLFAQQQARPGAFVCVAGYGECGVWYYGPDSIYTDRGGYEQSWSLTGPCQEAVESSIRSLLKELPPDGSPLR